MKRVKPKLWSARNRSCQWGQGVLNARATTTTAMASFHSSPPTTLATGRVIGKCHNRHREEEFLKFMNLVDRQLPGETQIHIVLDNLATHKTPQVRNWFARRPRYVLHFTPTGSSWINQVERWFAKITTEAIRRGSFRSVKHLIEAIEAYIVEHNNEPKPFRWTATANSIFDKITA